MTLSQRDQDRLDIEEQTRKFLTSGGKIEILAPETKEEYDEKNRKLSQLIGQMTSPGDLPERSIGGDAWAEEGF